MVLPILYEVKQRQLLLFSFIISRWYPLRRTSLKLSRFFFDLLLNNVSSKYKVVPFDKIIVAFPEQSIISTELDIVWTFALCNVKFEKKNLPLMIVCIVSLSSKQTSSFFSTGTRELSTSMELWTSTSTSTRAFLVEWISKFFPLHFMNA